ncbi:MAG: hypothetical protein ACREMP_06630 [Candidatus Tyrphobacter sp.]
MKRLVAPVVIIAGAVLLQTAMPQRSLWHEGWYSVFLAFCLVYLVVCVRAVVRANARDKARPIVVGCGAGLLAFAGIASGLLAPDPQLVVGAPGTSVGVAGLGTIAFPPLGGASTHVAGAYALKIGAQRYTWSFVLRDEPRSVVTVDAFDGTGGHLTVTQPTGSLFSSPVLLMEQRQRISGLDLPFDSFSLPAVHRIVKVVLFSANQAALLRGIGANPAVLFAVDDDTDRPLPHAIALGRSGQRVDVGGLALRGSVESYPAVAVLAIPPLVALAAGLAMIAAGFLLRSFPASERATEGSI